MWILLHNSFAWGSEILTTKINQHVAQHVVLKMLNCDISPDSNGVCDRVSERPQLLSSATANSTMDSQGIEPWASRVLSGSDTTTPTALNMLRRFETTTFENATELVGHEVLQP